MTAQTQKLLTLLRSVPPCTALLCCAVLCNVPQRYMMSLLDVVPDDEYWHYQVWQILDGSLASGSDVRGILRGEVQIGIVTSILP